jgi:hypothetical protein
MTPEPSDFDTLESLSPPKKLAENRIVKQRITRHRLYPRGVDVDDGRPNFFHHRCKGKTNLARVLRRDFRSRLSERGRPYDRESQNKRQANQPGPPTSFMRPLI